MTEPNETKPPAPLPYRRDADQPAEAKPDTDSKAPSGTDDVGQDEVQKRTDEAEDQGFFGIKVDPRPNEDYALTTGPDSPPAVEDSFSRVEQRHSLQEGDR